jgi:hypothetical protein
MKHLDSNNTLPKDTAFPITTAAVSNHNMRIPQLSGVMQPVSLEEWKKNRQDDSI